MPQRGEHLQNQRLKGTQMEERNLRFHDPKGVKTKNPKTKRCMKQPGYGSSIVKSEVPFSSVLAMKTGDLNVQYEN
jgi:hypothetical protein